MYILSSSINADCSLLCVQEKVRMLIVVCLVFRRKWKCCGVLLFRGKAGNGSDEDADRGMLCVQGKSGRRQWRRYWLWCALCSGEKREAAVTKMLTVVCFIYVATITPSVTQAFFRTLIPGYFPSGQQNVTTALLHAPHLKFSKIKYSVF